MMDLPPHRIDLVYGVHLRDMVMVAVPGRDRRMHYPAVPVRPEFRQWCEDMLTPGWRIRVVPTHKAGIVAFALHVMRERDVVMFRMMYADAVPA